MKRALWWIALVPSLAWLIAVTTWVYYVPPPPPPAPPPSAPARPRLINAPSKPATVPVAKPVPRTGTGTGTKAPPAKKPRS